MFVPQCSEFQIVFKFSVCDGVYERKTVSLSPWPETYPMTKHPPPAKERQQRFLTQFQRLSPEIHIPLNPIPLKFSNRSRINFCRPLSATSDSRSGGTPDSEFRNGMFILGMGFVGGFLAQRLKEEDWVVSGTCRSDSKKKEWEKRGDLQLFTADSPEWSLLETVKDYTHLLISVPPLADIGDPMLRNVAHVRDKLSSGNLRWLCYLSSTSVYGDYGGAWVNEDHPPNPKTQSAKLRLAAEEGWLSVGRVLGVSTQVLRLGGIYGPVRLGGIYGPGRRCEK